jgi:hypothetical protein
MFEISLAQAVTSNIDFNILLINASTNKSSSTEIAASGENKKSLIPDGVKRVNQKQLLKMEWSIQK